ncbi:exoribonuclease II [Candidatus Fukatsuia symbiotica]|uniref:exoribonuclease II n=1 Tax=Candidatus Fukatsuia TaxID=1927833 RepID=UPI000933A9E7|nr:exoribonuclease II [Candidatus Fukatsuia symbiotica]MEA9444646.1 exoribonuclease II [Candidatus Fukatsuia symbiotica]
MFQNNPLLAQLKKQLHIQTPRIEGVVKGTEKSFGFLEVDGQKSYFIPPPQMKKVMHGDRVLAVLRTDKNREIVEPESLVEPFLSRFVGRIQKTDQCLFIIPDHPLLRDAIPCSKAPELTHNFQNGDWAVAEMRHHPLKDNRIFSSELTAFITDGDDHFAPWWVTLARYNLEREAPAMPEGQQPVADMVREDLTHLHFITIDSASTEDMDDALYVEEKSDGSMLLVVAIADPTAYVDENSQLDHIARQRGFTNYLPGFNIPMLPRDLSENLCSLHPNKRRPVLVCRMTITASGALGDDIQFSVAWIESKAKLVYDQISDWLENRGDWQPQNSEITAQITLLQRVCNARDKWRRQHALVFKDHPDYRFSLGEKGEVLDIIVEQRRIANRIVEECMIAANICAAIMLRAELGFGIYNVHAGFDPVMVEQVSNVLKTYDIDTDPKALLTLEGFCQLRRHLDTLPTPFLDGRIRRFQTFAEISTQPSPHFGLGLEAYATWTSPIRKYGDMVNHRLLKAIINRQQVNKPQDEIGIQLAERRRLNRMAERDVGDWLYARYLQPLAGTDRRFSAEIIDVTRGGVRVRLLENGAMAFIPGSFIHAVRDELTCSQEAGSVQIKGKTIFRQNDNIEVQLVEVRMGSRNVIARPI